MGNVKPIIAVDFDDVIADYARAYERWHNAEFGTTIEYHEHTTFDLCLLYNIDHATLTQRLQRFAEECHESIVPIDGALEGIRELSKHFEPHVVTSRCESLAMTTQTWAQKHIIDFSAYHFTNGIASIYPQRRRKKLDVCREIGAITLIEDADHNALEVAQGGITVIQPKRPWNGAVSHENIVYVERWDEIVVSALRLLSKT